MPPTKPDPEKYCLACLSLLRRRRYTSALEDLSAFVRRKYCSRACMAKGMVKDTITRSGYLVRARKYLRDKCEQCGVSEKLSIHHKDRDWSNNEPSNLQTLCTSCHTILHHKNGDIKPKKAKEATASFLSWQRTHSEHLESLLSLA